MNKDWKKILLSPQNSLRDALMIVNEEALRVALVVDEQNRLSGILTDGDIRRSILANVSLDTAVSAVMNRHPRTTTIGYSRREVLAEMKKHSILSLPVVSENGVLIGLETWDAASAHRCYEHPVFIMAGGFGTRLKPLTDNCPKPMLKVGKKPMLEILIERFAKTGFRNIYISTHYLPDVIRDYFGNGERWGVNIEYVYEETPMGTGGALGLLPCNIPELPLMMINGDVLTSLDFERLMHFHETHSPDVTMCVRQYEYQVPYGVINHDGDAVVGMTEKPVQHHFVNAGIYVLSPKVFKNVKKGVCIDMPTLIDTNINSNGKVLMFPVHDYWIDIGRPEDFYRAQSDIYQLEEW
ncbi:nucleotidyltransferase family protein [Enterobacter ludwigii]